MPKPKEKLLDSRPEAPTLDNILEDLSSAKEDDIAFHFLSLRHEKLDEQKMMQDDSSFKSSGSHGVSENTGKRKDSSEGEKADELYSQVESFLEMNRYLSQSQGTLSEQYANLEKLGEDIKMQAEELRKKISIN